MCHGHVDAKLLEREAMDRLRAAQPQRESATPAEAGPPPELMGGLAGVLARIRRALRQGATGRRVAGG